MRSIQRITLIVLVVSSFACTKQEDPPSNPPVRVPISATLQNLIFEEGSFWIYKRLTDSSIDSVEVIGTGLQWLYISGGPGSGVQTILQELSMTYYSTKFNYYTEYAAYHILSEGKMSGGIKFIGGTNVGDSLLNTSLTEIHDTLIINGEAYTNVIEMHVGKDEYIDDDMNLYYADSIGVIRKEIKDSTSVVETWDLIRYNVTVYDLE